MANISSDKIRVFPSIGRDSTVDNESELSTENNLSQIVRSLCRERKSFVISSSLSNGPFEFVIYGFYFKILDGNSTLTNLNLNTNLWAGIKIDSNALANNSSEYYQLLTIANSGEAEKGFQSLDKNGNFIGLVIGDTEEAVKTAINPSDENSVFTLELLKNGSVPRKSLLHFKTDEILDGESESYISEHFTTNEINTTSLITTPTLSVSTITGNNLSINNPNVILTGATIINNTLTVTGKITGDNGITITSGGADITGSVSLKGNTNITGTLTVNDATTLNSTLTVANVITGKNGLTINGAIATFNNGISVNNGATINGTTSLNNNVIIGGTLTVNNGKTTLSNLTVSTILPNENGTRNLGSTSAKWNNVYANTLNGLHTGTLTTNIVKTSAISNSAVTTEKIKDGAVTLAKTNIIVSSSLSLTGTISGGDRRRTLEIKLSDK